MLSMENCVSGDGKTVYYLHHGETCASMDLKRYHFVPEPFNHIWMWMHNTTLMFTLVLVALLVLVYFLSHDKKDAANKDRDRRDHLV